MSGVLATEGLPVDPILDRRAQVQAIARRSLGRRNAVSGFMLGVAWLALVATLAVLGWILYLLVNRGAHFISVAFFTQVPQTPSLLNPSDVGGISTALIGSLIVDGLAIAMAVPVGVVAGLLLAEVDNPLTGVIRRAAEIMTGLPSILFGLFVYGLLIFQFKEHVSGFLGSISLAILMIPVIMKGSEVAFRSVPNAYREAGLALGLSKGTVSRRIVLPTATPGVLTGIIIATSRAVGETAPLIFLIGNTYVVQPNPFKPTTTLPFSIYNFFLNPLSSAQSEESWGIALVLAALVLVLNLGSRMLAAFLQRERR